MNVVLITGPYPPEVRAISLMMQELAESLSSVGHNVVVITSWPRYNLSDETKQTKFRTVSEENGVKVIRIRSLPVHRVSYLLRGIASLRLPYRFFGQVKKYIKGKIDAVIVYSPPLPFALVGAKIKERYGARYLLNIQDIFPQNAIDLGAIRNRTVIRFFEMIERKVYDAADRITAHSASNMMFLIEKKGIPSKKISVVHNWIDLDPYREIERTGVFRKRYGLEGKFIFLFAGVIGPSQNIDFIIRVAREVKGYKDICFLFVGDGIERKRVQRMAEKQELTNVVFRPFVSKDEYLLLVKDADVGLACLGMKNKTPVFPGKILSFMAAAIPTIAFLNVESDGHRIIKEARCGYSELSEDHKKASELVLRIYNQREKLAQYGLNGLRYAVTHFSKEGGIGKLEKLIVLDQQHGREKLGRFQGQ